MKRSLYDVIIEPVITEKVTASTERDNKYVFKVHSQAGKKEIKSAIEKLFSVHVIKVNVINQVGKWRRLRFQAGKTASWKKAIISVKKGEKIDLKA